MRQCGGDDGGEVESVGESGEDARVEVADGGIETGQHTDRPQDHPEEGEDGGDEQADAGGKTGAFHGKTCLFYSMTGTCPGSLHILLYYTTKL